MIDEMESHHRKNIKALLKKGINAQDDDGFTPLIYAVRLGDFDLVKKFLSQGADVNIATKYGSTALQHHDVDPFKLDSKIVKLLVQAGANINHKDVGQTTALFNTIVGLRVSKHFQVKYKQHLNVIRFLLKSGANPDIQDRRKMTVLHWAAQSGETECIKILLEYNANVNKKNNQGVTPLMSACTSGVRENVELLLTAGALVNEIAKDGFTALMCAAYYGNVDIVQVLLDNGANKMAKSKKGDTALSIAQKKKFESVIGILR